MFVKFNTSHATVILVYVDDIIITKSSGSFVQQLISELHANLSLKDLGDLSY